MKLKVVLLTLLYSMATHTNAQSLFNIDLNIGDPAPAIKVKSWIKGKSVDRFEANKIYVIDFWATWCFPCMALMPHYSALANKYKEKATFLSIDIYEKQNIPVEKIKKLVDSMGNRMDFTVGIEEEKYMSKKWADASRERGIPSVFIINDGRIAWIGHPKHTDSVLTEILNKRWNPNFALIKRNHQLYMAQLEIMAGEDLTRGILKYQVNKPGNTYDRIMVSPDSVLLAVNEMVKNIPEAEFLPVFVARKFQALLRLDPEQAEHFARKAMTMPGVYGDPAFRTLIYQIEDASDRMQLPANIFKLGIECCQAFIDSDPYPELGVTASTYRRMAGLYRQLGDITKAAEAEQKGKLSLLAKKW